MHTDSVAGTITCLTCCRWPVRKHELAVPFSSACTTEGAYFPVHLAHYSICGAKCMQFQFLLHFSFAGGVRCQVHTGDRKRRCICQALRGQVLRQDAEHTHHRPGKFCKSYYSSISTLKGQCVSRLYVQGDVRCSVQSACSIFKLGHFYICYMSVSCISIL